MPLHFCALNQLPSADLAGPLCVAVTELQSVIWCRLERGQPPLALSGGSWSRAAPWSTDSAALMLLLRMQELLPLRQDSQTGDWVLPCSLQVQRHACQPCSASSMSSYPSPPIICDLQHKAPSPACLKQYTTCNKVPATSPCGRRCSSGVQLIPVASAARCVRLPVPCGWAVAHLPTCPRGPGWQGAPLQSGGVPHTLTLHSPACRPLSCPPHFATAPAIPQAGAELQREGAASGLSS